MTSSVVRPADKAEATESLSLIGSYQRPLESGFVSEYLEEVASRDRSLATVRLVTREQPLRIAVRGRAAYEAR